MNTILTQQIRRVKTPIQLTSCWKGFQSRLDSPLVSEVSNPIVCFIETSKQIILSKAL